MKKDLEILNPFHHRGPLRESRLFCDREKQKRQITQLLRNAQTINLCGKSRVGKTSLLYYLINQFEEQEKDETVTYRYICVFLDLATLTSLSDTQSSIPTRFFRFLFKHIHQSVQKSKYVKDCLSENAQDQICSIYKEAFSAESEDDFLLEMEDYLSILFDQESWIRYIPFTLVISIDTVEQLIHENIARPLRAFASVFSISYILVTRQPLNKLDTEGVSSPLFNICTIIPLGMLDKAGSLEILKTTAPEAYEQFVEDDINIIIDSGGGHPDFLLVSAWTVFENIQNGRRAEKDEILWKINEGLNGACLTLWNSLPLEERVTCWRVANDEKVSPNLKPSYYLLSDYGIINDRGKIFSSVFRDYVIRQQVITAVLENEVKDDISSETVPVEERIRIEESVLIYNNIEISLTPQESSLITHLNEHLGEFCQRKDLFKHVWGEENYDEEKNAPTINIAVQRLRDKLLEEIGSKIIIEAKRGKGYRLLVSA